MLSAFLYKKALVKALLRIYMSFTLLSTALSYEVDEATAVVVRKIFDLYNNGWGYKKIANYLTDQGIPTPRMAEKARIEADGTACKLTARPEQSIITISGIVHNDFYIGTLRQGKYRRCGISSKDFKQNEDGHIVFEKHHEAIVDDRTFAYTQEQMKKRMTNAYHGVGKYHNPYSGFLYCGDCGSPMFAISRADLAPAYTCGNYHRRGRKSCTSHHTRMDLSDALLKQYMRYAHVTFQSTHPVRGGTGRRSGDRALEKISIHPPREGWDGNVGQYTRGRGHFNPPTP